MLRGPEQRPLKRRAMKAVIQRVRSASVSVGARIVSEIGRGIVVLAAVEKGDPEDAIEGAARKIRQLRIFSDDAGRMNRSLGDVGGEILAVSQFTLAGSIARGRRPSFTGAEEPDRANALFERFVVELGREGATVRTGEFGAMMLVSIENDGPVTFILDTAEAGGS